MILVWSALCLPGEGGYWDVFIISPHIFRSGRSRESFVGRSAFQCGLRNNSVLVFVDGLHVYFGLHFCPRKGEGLSKVEALVYTLLHGRSPPVYVSKSERVHELISVDIRCAVLA